MVDGLLAGHGRFRSEFAADQRELLARLAREGQRPTTLLIGCADSRVIPELLTGAGPGDLFVVRNVANRVPPLGDLDSSVGAAVEFAIEQLGVSEIVVCGHDDCGGITAAFDELPGIQADSALARWLSDLGPAIQRARALAADRPAQLHRAAEEHVLDGLANLMTYPVVRQGVALGNLRLHAWVYAVADATLRVYDRATDAFGFPELPTQSSR